MDYVFHRPARVRNARANEIGEAASASILPSRTLQRAARTRARLFPTPGFRVDDRSRDFVRSALISLAEREQKGRPERARRDRIPPSRFKTVPFLSLVLTFLLVPPFSLALSLSIARSLVLGTSTCEHVDIRERPRFRTRQGIPRKRSSRGRRDYDLPFTRERIVEVRHVAGDDCGIPANSSGLSAIRGSYLRFILKSAHDVIYHDCIDHLASAPSRDRSRRVRAEFRWLAAFRRKANDAHGFLSSPVSALAGILLMLHYNRPRDDTRSHYHKRRPAIATDTPRMHTRPARYS